MSGRGPLATKARMPNRAPPTPKLFHSEIQKHTQIQNIYIQAAKKAQKTNRCESST